MPDHAIPPPVRIVLIDNDPAVLDALSFSLQSKGFEVASYLDAAEFLAAPEPGPPACVVIDQNLGTTTGLAVARTLRRRGSRLPLVMISSVVTSHLRALARGAGFSAVLEKPLFGDMLASTLSKIVHTEGKAADR